MWALENGVRNKTKMTTAGRMPHRGRPDLMCVSNSYLGKSELTGRSFEIPFVTKLATAFAGEKFIADAIHACEAAVTIGRTGEIPDLFVLGGDLWND